MKDQQLNPMESLELIERTITATRNKLARNAAIPMLTWGYSTLATILIVWTASLLTHSPYCALLWMLIPLLGVISTRMFFHKPAEESANTLLDTVIRKLWVVIGTIVILFTPIAIYGAVGEGFTPDSRVANIDFYIASCYNLTAILLLLGVGHTITGYILNFRPSIIGGVAAILLIPVIQYFMASGLTLALIALTVAFMVMGIIPGHLLIAQTKRQKSCSKS